MIASNPAKHIDYAALKCILGIGELLVGRLLCFNALDMMAVGAEECRR